MKSLILATLFLCSPVGCEEKTVHVEPKACSVGTLHAQLEQSGVPVEVTFGVRCKKA